MTDGQVTNYTPPYMAILEYLDLLNASVVCACSRTLLAHMASSPPTQLRAEAATQVDQGETRESPPRLQPIDETRKTYSELALIRFRHVGLLIDRSHTFITQCKSEQVPYKLKVYLTMSHLAFMPTPMYGGHILNFTTRPGTLAIVRTSDFNHYIKPPRTPEEIRDDFVLTGSVVVHLKEARRVKQMTIRFVAEARLAYPSRSTYLYIV